MWPIVDHDSVLRMFPWKSKNTATETERRPKSFLLRRRLIACYVQLEHDLGAKLQYAWAPIAGRRAILPARRVSPCRIDCVELRVVEGVVRFGTELEVSPFGDRKVLVKRRREIDTSRAYEGVFASVTETEVGTTLVAGGRGRQRILCK